jgi:hypothetical protein
MAKQFVMKDLGPLKYFFETEKSQYHKKIFVF